MPVRGEDDILAFVRQSDEQRWLVALNFTSKPRRVRLPGHARARVLLSTHLDRAETVSGEVNLRPDEGVIASIQERRLASRNDATS